MNVGLERDPHIRSSNNHEPIKAVMEPGRMFPAFIFSLSVLAGVLLDIQRHYGVTDSGIGLLQTGKRPVEVVSPEQPQFLIR